VILAQYAGRPLRSFVAGLEDHQPGLQRIFVYARDRGDQRHSFRFYIAPSFYSRHAPNVAESLKESGPRYYGPAEREVVCARRAGGGGDFIGPGFAGWRGSAGQKTFRGLLNVNESFFAEDSAGDET